MPSVNMIAARRAEKHRLEQNTRKLVYGVVGELGLILVVVSFMLAHLITTQTHVGVLDEQLKNLQPKVEEIKELEADTTTLQPKVQVLDMARGDTLYWYTALQNLTLSLPPKTWITSVSTNGTPVLATSSSSGTQAPTQTASSSTSSGSSSSAALTVAGMSASQDEVGQAMLKMNTFPDFDQAVLGSVQKSDVGKVPAVSFQLTVQLKPDTGNSQAQGTAIPGGTHA